MGCYSDELLEDGPDLALPGMPPWAGCRGELDGSLFALLTAGAALILGYLPVALGLSPLLALFIGGALISCLLPILSRSRRSL